MDFVAVNEVPKRRINYSPARDIISKFLQSGHKIAKVPYCGPSRKGYYNVLYKAVTRGGYPVSISMADGEIYLIRKEEHHA